MNSRKLFKVALLAATGLSIVVGVGVIGFALIPRVHIDCLTSADIETWHDLNSNGSRDPDEPGLPNIAFGTLTQDGNLIWPEETSGDGHGKFSLIISCDSDSERLVAALPRPHYKLTTNETCIAKSEGAKCTFGFSSTCVVTEDYLRAFHPKGFFHVDDIEPKTLLIETRKLVRTELDSDANGRILEIYNNKGCINHARAIIIDSDNTSEDDATRNAYLLALVAQAGLTPNQRESAQSWLDRSLSTLYDEALNEGHAEAKVRLSPPNEHPLLEFSSEYHDTLAITRLFIRFQE